MSRFLLVEMQDDLHASREVGIFHSIRFIPGVVSVTDLTAISQETLDAVLLKPEPIHLEDEPERAWQLQLIAEGVL